MSQINPNLNNIFLKKQVHPNFRADNSAQYQPASEYSQHEDYGQYQEYYYPEEYYTDDSQYQNYYPQEAYEEQVAYPENYQVNPQDIYNMAYDKKGQPVLPSFYENADKKEPKSIMETLKNEPTKMISTWFTNPLLMLGTCAGLSYGVDAFNKGCSGEYEKTILGKATRFGDKLEKSKFAQSKPVQTTVKGIKNGWDKTWKFLNKSDLIRSMFKTPSKPEWDSAKYDIIPQDVRILEDFNTITERLQLASDAPIQLKDVGVTREERKFLKEIFNVNSISKIPEEASVNTILLKRMGRTEPEILNVLNSSVPFEETKSQIRELLGFNLDDIKDIKLKPEDHVDRVKEACNKAGGKIKVMRGHHEILGDFQPLASEISCDQIANKLKSLRIGEGAETATGKAMSQLVQKIHRGFTFGGGKLAIFFFIAPWLVMAMKNTKKADPDQKVGTAAYGLVESISWVFTFPLAIKTIYALGGMKYAGMNEDDVTKLRDLIKNFNETEFKDKKTYDKVRKALEKELKTLKNKNNTNLSLFSKIMKKIQSGLQVDLEMLKPFQDGNKFKDFMRRIPNNAKNWFGVPLRVIITGFVIESAYRELLMKGVKGIFGKNYDEFKEEEHESAKKAQKEFTIQDLRKRMLEIQASKINGTEIVEQNEFAIPEDMSKMLAYEKRKEAFEEQQNPKETENLVTDKTELVKEEKSIQEYSEPLASSSMIDDYVESTKQAQTKPEETSYDKNTILEQTKQAKESFKEEKEEIPVTKQTQTSETNTQKAPVTNNLTPEIIAAATSGATATAIANRHPVSQDNYTYIPSQKPSKHISEQKKETKKRDNYTYIPSEKNVIKEDKNDEKINKYIPSQRAANISKSFDNSGLDYALARADRAEQRALQILAGNFDGMV